MLRQCRLLLSLTLIGLMGACSQPPSKMILGAWQEQGGKEVLEFFKDGTVSVNGAIVGDFSFLDEKRIKLNLTGWGALAGPQMFTLDANKTTLALTDSRGKTSVYARTQGGATGSAKATSEASTSEGEGATKGNLGAMRSALSIYYGDLEGVYPADLAQLTKNGKYLSAIPSANTGHHPRSGSIISACDTNQLKDTGGWAYCNKPKSKNFGNLLVDCTHRDSKGNFWYSY